MQYGKSQEAIDRLTAEQRRVTQEAGTERPFTGEYNDHTEPGIRPRDRNLRTAIHCHPVTYAPDGVPCRLLRPITCRSATRLSPLASWRFWVPHREWVRLQARHRHCSEDRLCRAV